MPRSPPPLPFVFCNGRRLCRRPCPICPSETPPLAPAGPVHWSVFLPMLNYRTANCPRIAAPCCASVKRIIECPAALFHSSAQPNPSIFGWIFSAHLSLVANGDLSQFAMCHQHFTLLCGPLFLSMLHRTANCPRIAAPHCASVECPAALFYNASAPSQRPRHLVGYLFRIYHWL